LERENQKLKKVACVQMNSGGDIHKNLEAAAVLIRQAASQGAQYILTPEVTDQVVSNRAERLAHVFLEEDHPAMMFFSSLAMELSVVIGVGSICVQIGDQKIANRSLVFGTDGVLVARYDKIHLYDVDLPSGESHRESAVFDAGQNLVVAQAEGMKVGMSICYDLRFSHLYRDMAKLGAQILSVPAAFTVPTGRAHWEVLLRARAIETGCFVMAAAQSGDHCGVRQTYGHSMIVSPWGEVLALIEEEEGVIVTDIDLDEIVAVRRAIPALYHDREYQI